MVALTALIDLRKDPVKTPKLFGPRPDSLVD